MKISVYTEKLNKVDGNVYVIEEEVQLSDGVYEAPLAHDNINTATLAVWTGPKLTGERIQSYVLSTPSLTPWKRLIRLYADVPTVYISYETDGDIVEAEDINLIQDDLIRTQEEINVETNRAEEAESVLQAGLAEESFRAKEAEKTLKDDLKAETARAMGAERILTDGIEAETARAKAAEQATAGDLSAEAVRAQAAEKNLTDRLGEETVRAAAAEQVLTDNLAAETARAGAAEVRISDDLSEFKNNIITKPEIDALDGIEPEPGEIRGEPISIEEINNIVSR